MDGEDKATVGEMWLRNAHDLKGESDIATKSFWNCQVKFASMRGTPQY